MISYNKKLKRHQQKEIVTTMMPQRIVKKLTWNNFITCNLWVVALFVPH